MADHISRAVRTGDVFIKPITIPVIMSLLSSLLDHNQQFVASHRYEAYRVHPQRDKNLAILACMDARLVELLPQAMGVRNGSAKLIKNAGALVTHPWGSVMRSLLLAIYELGVREICVVAHYDCGVSHTCPERILQRAQQRGISEQTLQTLRAAGIDLENWLHGFDHAEESVHRTVELICEHPLIPQDVPVHGLLIHPETGQLDLLVDGYQRNKNTLAAADAVSNIE